jgi:hypothetical protein
MMTMQRVTESAPNAGLERGSGRFQLSDEACAAPEFNIITVSVPSRMV